MGEKQHAWRGEHELLARQLVASAALVLVDFDGPLARLLPGDRWLEVAAQVRARAGELGGPELAAALDGEPDHVQCLRRVHELAPDLVPPLVEGVTRLELEAASRVAPADHAVEFLTECLDRGAAVVVVTNNHPHVVARVLDPDQPGLHAAQPWPGSAQPGSDQTGSTQPGSTQPGPDLERPRLSARLTLTLGRDPDRLDALKPSPAMLLQALELTGARRQDAIFLGDSVTDVEAGRAAGVPVVGVAEEPERRAELLAAGALAAVPDVGRLLRSADRPDPSRDGERTAYHR